MTSIERISMSEVTFDQEVQEGNRFEFGKNWRSFIDSLTDERIEVAEESVRSLLHVDTLEGKRFIDVGCGSGLFSLAARRLGATVHSFDYDKNSVASAQILKQTFFPDDDDWRIEQGSALDTEYLSTLGTFDVVYSWGVLHHTGEMWKALENVTKLMGKDAQLVISIYNDQGWKSKAWTGLKKAYCKAPTGVRQAYLFSLLSALEFKALVYCTLKGNPTEWITRKLNYATQTKRGMSYFHDMIDWIGGYPFEVASTDAIVDFYRTYGLEPETIRSVKAGGQGCNEFVLRAAD